MSNSYNEVSFSTLANIKDNSITNWYTLPWEQLAELIETQGHLVTHNKDVSLISPWTYKTPTQDFEPRRTPDGDLWTIDDEPVVGRLASNVLGTDLLMFDFDGTLTISEATTLFADYTHVGYKAEPTTSLIAGKSIMSKAEKLNATSIIQRVTGKVECSAKDAGEVGKWLRSQGFTTATNKKFIVVINGSWCSETKKFVKHSDLTPTTAARPVYDPLDGVSSKRMALQALHD